MLNDVPEGKYRVLLNYYEKPNGADFQVWQRQKRLSDWISSKGGNPENRDGLQEGDIVLPDLNDPKREVRKDRVCVGEIQLTEQTNSLTFHVRNNNGADQFELDLLILERID